MARKEETVERGYGYRIYFSDGIYFLDLQKFCASSNVLYTCPEILPFTQTT